ncbi:hypothetical protein B0H17DRAFT_1129953 [Mycena rosella]|uniref:Uncharacterized protein n=1 Tax=Mycena rosella TaxID=1033263 RepID=A0AAD7DRF2_MYCRO|nr:hypothetical protein B0H17DRAFT_1129953 [Mycena rosella]
MRADRVATRQDERQSASGTTEMKPVKADGCTVTVIRPPSRPVGPLELLLGGMVSAVPSTVIPVKKTAEDGDGTACTAFHKVVQRGSQRPSGQNSNPANQIRANADISILALDHHVAPSHVSIGPFRVADFELISTGFQFDFEVGQIHLKSDFGTFGTLTSERRFNFRVMCPITWDNNDILKHQQ